MRRTRKRPEKNAALTAEELEAKKEKRGQGSLNALLYVTVAISIVISVAAFMLLPYALASLCRKVGASEVVVTIVEAFVKLASVYGIHDSDLQNEGYSENLYVSWC